MRTVPVLTAAEAAQADRRQRDVITRLLLVRPRLSRRRAGGDRRAVRRRPASPADLTSLHPIAAGDMYGIKGIDHLCRPGQLRRVSGRLLSIGRLEAGPAADPAADPLRSDPGATTSRPGCCSRCTGQPRPGSPGCSPRSVSAPTPIRGSEGAKMNAVTDDFVQLMQVAGKRVPVLSRGQGRRRDHPRHHRGRVRQPVL